MGPWEDRDVDEVWELQEDSSGVRLKVAGGDLGEDVPVRCFLSPCSLGQECVGQEVPPALPDASEVTSPPCRRQEEVSNCISPFSGDQHTSSVLERKRRCWRQGFFVELLRCH